MRLTPIQKSLLGNSLKRRKEAVDLRKGRLPLGRLARVDQQHSSEVTHSENRIGNGGEIRGLSSTPKACSCGSETSRQYDPRRRRAGWCSIIRAKGVRGRLPIVGDPFELAAHVLEVFRADMHAEHFLDHGEEISKRTIRAQRRGIGGTA